MSGLERESQVGRVIPNAPFGSPQRKRLPHLTPPWVGSGAIFFITLCCGERRTNQLARPEGFSVITSAVHYVTAENFWAHLVLAMRDHLHALLSFPPAASMESAMRIWKRFVAKEAQVKWQDGFFDHRLRDHENFGQKAHYVRMNPVRVGLASQPEERAFVWPADASDPAR